MLRYLLLTGFVFLLSGGVFATTILQLDPMGENSILIHGAFFLALFCGIASFMTLFFFFLKELFARKTFGERTFFRSMRQGGLVAGFVTVISLLQWFRLLGGLEAILLAIFLALVEYVIRHREA